MPSVGRFLELVNAASRRDADGLVTVVRAAAQAERKKKHFHAARQLFDAADSLAARAADTKREVSFSAVPTAAPPLEFVDAVAGVDDGGPILSEPLRSSVALLLEEWAHEEELRAEGLSARNTVLLCGAPGTGKTHLARHLAGSLGMPLFLVRFDSLVSSFLGETASNLRQVFEFFSANRCVLLLDEIDAIAKLRDDRNELGELKRVVVSLLQQLDYAGNRSLLVAATNHPQVLDPALWRRFEVVWQVPLPDATARAQVLDHALCSSVPSESKRIVVEVADGLTGAELVRIAVASRRMRVLDRQLDVDEALLLATVDTLRRHAPDLALEDAEEKLTRIGLALRDLANCRRYSFQSLQQLTGIPHSTLHHRARRPRAGSPAPVSDI